MLRRIHPLRTLATLVIFAGAIGLVQLPVPARHARLSDFVIDALAACAGIGAAVVIGKLRTSGLRCPGIAWGANERLRNAAALSPGQCHSPSLTLARPS